MADAPHLPFIVRGRAVVLGVAPDGRPEIVENGAIHVAGGRILAIGPAGELIAAAPDVTVTGDNTTVLTPGFVNSHHHFGLTPLMMGVPFRPLELWLPLFRGMRGVGQRLDTLYSAIEMLESGTTTVQHIQGGVAGPEEGWHEAADDVIGAYREIGMRVSWSFMIRDRNQIAYVADEEVLSGLPDDVAAYFRPRLAASTAPVARHMAFFEDIRRRWLARDADRVRVQLAPANLHWLTDDSLVAIFDTARRTGAKLHMHLVETERQARFARQRTGRSAVGHLARLGCLTPDLTLGHGIWCDAADLDLLAEHSCQICHNASSGLRLASGIAPVTEMTRRGLKVALGIDQSNIDDDRSMLTEMRLVWALHGGSRLFNDRPSPAEVFRMASEHGALTTGFSGEIGRLAPGMAADMVAFDWREIARPFVEADTPLVDALVLRSRQKAVDRVWVGGCLAVADGKVTTIDRDAVMTEIAERLERPFSPEETLARDMARRLTGALEARHRASHDDAGAAPYRYNLFGEG